MQNGLDDIDRRILGILQEDGRTSLARIGAAVALSPPAVTERIRKLEGKGVLQGTVALLDGRALGLDVTAFIHVSLHFPRSIDAFEELVEALPEVLECHHVTGAHTLVLKVKTRNTLSLEAIISRLRSAPGVDKTETVVVLSTRFERTQIPLS